MKYLRAIAAWLLWALGDLFFHVMCLLPNSETWTGTWYQVYNRFMIWSSKAQGFGPGPWVDTKE